MTFDNTVITTEMCLGDCQTSMVVLFCEYKERL